MVCWCTHSLVDLRSAALARISGAFAGPHSDALHLWAAPPAKPQAVRTKAQDQTMVHGQQQKVIKGSFTTTSVVELNQLALSKNLMPGP